MKIKVKIENLKDLRRNLWITSAGIIGGLAVSVLNAKDFVFNWIVVAKLFIFVLGMLLASFFIGEVISCNKDIKNHINKLKEE